jgi:hypothetical protein
MKREKLTLYIGNLLVDFIDALYQRRDLKLPDGAGNDSTRSLTKYTQAAEKIGKKNWEKDFGLPLSYYKTLQRYAQVYISNIILRCIPAHIAVKFCNSSMEDQSPSPSSFCQTNIRNSSTMRAIKQLMIHAWNSQDFLYRHPSEKPMNTTTGESYFPSAMAKQWKNLRQRRMI